MEIKIRDLEKRHNENIAQLDQNDKQYAAQLKEQYEEFKDARATFEKRLERYNETIDEIELELAKPDAYIQWNKTEQEFQSLVSKKDEFETNIDALTKQKKEIAKKLHESTIKKTQTESDLKDQL